MIHFQTAYEFDSNADLLFYIGNLVPDALDEWQAKDATHFRDVPDRAAALVELMHKTDLSDPFAYGILFHLYTDMLWDEGYMYPHRKEYKGDNWFKDYRNEIKCGGSLLFHKSEWVQSLWQKMTEVSEKDYGETPGTDAKTAFEYLVRTYNWHVGSNEPLPKSFDEKILHEFAKGAAESFKTFIERKI